ncbi:MAG: pantetheine-phosphate adenylyltransferase [Pseudomonadota bacterium]|nr:pantetheine-phosphate adenylyltransferase [Pseudomonadota bacterium]
MPGRCCARREPGKSIINCWYLDSQRRQNRQEVPVQGADQTVSTLAVYPGTFDPMTMGHVDVVRRAARLFDRVVVGVADSRAKRPFFSIEERVDMAREIVRVYPNVEVMGFSGLLADFLRSIQADVILRGLRAVSDFEFEFQMAGMNRKLHPEVETLFVTPSDQYMFISSTIVREIAGFGGDVAPFVPPIVAERIRARVGEIQQQGR